VVDKSGIDTKLALEAEFHQIDSSAGRIHLLAPERVRGTGGEAKPAMDALVDEVGRGRIVRVEDADTGFGRIRGFSHRIRIISATKFLQQTGRDSALRWGRIVP